MYTEKGGEHFERQETETNEIFCDAECPVLPAVHEKVLCFAVGSGYSHDSVECSSPRPDDVSAQSSDFLLYGQP